MKPNPKRKHLFDLSNKCHWCTGIMALDLPQDHPALATIDHIKCKAECETRSEYNADKNQVLACQKCNHDRNVKFEADRGDHPKTPWWNAPKNKSKTKGHNSELAENAKPVKGHTY